MSRVRGRAALAVAAPDAACSHAASGGEAPAASVAAGNAAALAPAAAELMWLTCM